MDKIKAVHDLGSNFALLFKIIEQIDSGLLTKDGLKNLLPELSNRKVEVLEILKELGNE